VKQCDDDPAENFPVVACGGEPPAPIDLQRVFRILDASANRVTEGLRTIEEYARMVLDHHGWTTAVKELRHEVARGVALLPHAALLAARDTDRDCGTTIHTPQEQYRGDLEQVARAAWGRVQQGLRSLEEYGKLVSLPMVEIIQTVRYASYSLEQTMHMHSYRQQLLRGATLYAIIDFSLPGLDFVPSPTATSLPHAEPWGRRVAELIGGGVDVLQIREKRASDLVLWDGCRIAAQVRDACASQHPCRLIINDRADLAVACGADGVHVGQDELPVSAVRRVVGQRGIVGVSTHDLHQLRRAIAEGADYVGCGPTFPSGTKSFGSFSGLDFLRQAARQCQHCPPSDRDRTTCPAEPADGGLTEVLPAYAIGGITLENVSQVIAAGFSRIAVRAALWKSDDPVRDAARFRQCLSPPNPSVPGTPLP